LAQDRRGSGIVQVPLLRDATMGDLGMAEAFEGESQLSEEERTRRLILHFAVPRTLMTCDMVAGQSSEHTLNEMLAEMSWGTLEAETAEWVIKSEEPTLDAPDDSLISYTEFLRERYPCGKEQEDSTADENKASISQKCGSFTNPGEPGQKFRAMYDQMVKCLTFSKQVLKGYNLNKVCMTESEIGEDPTAEDFINVARYGRFQILPAFYNLLVYLTKEKRRFSIVFRSFGNDEIKLVQRELRMFCGGQHPCYSGGNKTKKPPNMTGEKGSKDMTLQDDYIGVMDRMGERLEFIKRNAEKKKEETEKKEGATEGEAAKDAAADEDDMADLTGPVFTPTVYAFDGVDLPPFHQAYSGLQHQILEEVNTAAIKDDMEYWEGNGRESSMGKLLLVDEAETKVQQIFFDGNIHSNDAHCVDVRNVVNGGCVPFEEASDVYLHRTNLWNAITDDQYYIKQLAACELKMSQRIVARKKAKVAPGDGDLSKEELAELLKGLGPKEYLYRTVIPALLPALEVCQRDRPEDPISFISFYLLRHTKQYQKSLKP